MNKTTILIGLVVLFLIVLGAAYTFTVDTPDVTQDTQYQTVRNVFVDIDGDGQLDFLAEGTVVLNRGGQISVPVEQGE